MGEIRRLFIRSQGFKRDKTPGLLDNGHKIIAKYIEAEDFSQVRCSQIVRRFIAKLDQGFKFGIDNETTLARFLLASLHDRGIHWPQIPTAEGIDVDAAVCAFLGTVDSRFNSAMELNGRSVKVTLNGKLSTGEEMVDVCTVNTIMNSLTPGQWAYASTGYPYWIRHAKKNNIYIEERVSIGGRSLKGRIILKRAGKVRKRC